MPRGDGPAPSPTPAGVAAAAAAAPAAVACTSPPPPPPRTPAPSPGAAVVTATPTRTAKRRAAEAALSRRFAGGRTAGALTPPTVSAAADPPPPPPAVTVPPCAAAAAGGPVPSTWCGGFPVTIHRWAWPALAGGEVAVVPPHACPAAHHAAGRLTAAIVEAPADLPAALAHLRASMRDRLLSIDLEWSPDRRSRRRARRSPSSSSSVHQPSPVGLVQLASGSHALLIRVCCFGSGRGLPPPLAAFLADPAVTVVGFAWDGGDEAKAVATWGRGRRDGLFGCDNASSSSFIDAQAVARAMGYARLGLAALAARVLGVALPKCAAVARSDWGRAGAPLTGRQVRYAALDALAAGHVLRGLRLLHARGGAEAPCPGCAVPVGAVVVGGGGGDESGSVCCAPGAACAPPPPPPTCGGCGATFADGQALANHARATGHGGGGGGGVSEACEGCGRWVGVVVEEDGGRARKRRRKEGGV
jgi:hypothetical protein